MNRIIVRVGLAPPERTYFSSIIRYGGHVPGRIKNIFIHVDEQNRNKTRKNDPKYGPTTTRSTTMLMIIIIILLLFRLRTPRVLKFVTSPDVLFYDFFFCSVSKFFFTPSAHGCKQPLGSQYYYYYYYGLRRRFCTEPRAPADRVDVTRSKRRAHVPVPRTELVGGETVQGSKISVVKCLCESI